jgi:hypothetical protein
MSKIVETCLCKGVSVPGDLYLSIASSKLAEYDAASHCLITLAMLQRHTLRRLRRATGRSRLPLVPMQGSRLLYRDLATAAVSSSPNDPFANGTNTYYAEEMCRHWRQDLSLVHASWNAYFSGGTQLDDHLKVCTPADYINQSKANIPCRCNCLSVHTKCADATLMNTRSVTGVAYRDLDAIWLSRWNRNKTLSHRHLGTSQSDAGKGRVFERNRIATSR